MNPILPNMVRIIASAGVILSMFASESGSCRAANKPPTVTTTSKRPDANAPQPIRRIELKEMQFANRALGETVRRLHAEAEEMARPEWHHRPFEYQDSGIYYAHWATFLEPDGKLPWNYEGPKDLNFISLGVLFDPDRIDPDKHHKIVGTILSARWNPGGPGWSASLNFRTFRGRPNPRDGLHDENFSCILHYHELPDGGYPLNYRIDLARGRCASFSQSFTFISPGEQYSTRYLISVGTGDGGPSKSVVPDRDVRTILSSPEAFRDYLVAAYTHLLNRVDEEIASKQASSHPSMIEN